LKVAKDKNWEVFGTEFTDEALKKCLEKGIKMHKGVLDPKNYEKEFDVITSFEVLEHINNPIIELQNFHKILRKNGLVYLTTPNFDALSRFYLQQNWSVIQYPEHLSYYTATTLQQVFEENGFQKLTIQTTGISFGRWQPPAVAEPIAKNKPENPIQTPTFREKDEELRQKVEQNRLLGSIKNSINFGLNLTRKGDTLKGFFEKK